MDILSQKIDRSIPIPYYYQLKNIVLEAIREGVYRPGDMIPTEIEISEKMELSRTTVRQALAELVKEGYLYRIKSKGTYVAQPKIKQDFIKRLESYNDQIIKSGHIPSTRVLALQKVKAPEDTSDALQLGEDKNVVMLRRLRLVDGVPNVVVQTFMPYDLCGFVLKHDFTKESLYTLLSASEETRICKVNRILEAVPGDDEDTKLLNIKHGAPVHFFTTRGYNSAGRPIEYSKARYRGDSNRFEVEMFVDTGKSNS